MSLFLKLSKPLEKAMQAVKSRASIRNKSNGIPRSLDPATKPTLDSVRLKRQLILPCNAESAEEKTRATYQDQGQFLARQDRWDELATLIRTADRSRAMSAGGVSHAELLAYGARADVVHAAEDAIMDGKVPDNDGINALEAIRMQYPDDPAIALIVSHAHMDIGWAWRGDGAEKSVRQNHMTHFRAHFECAASVIDEFNGVELDSPGLAAARVALLSSAERPQDQVADNYEDLIDLDPCNPRTMRGLGNHLLPRWFGSYAQLELEARRTASRTMDIWGAGGYTWSYLDALAVDGGASNLLDVDFFIEGMRDILQRRPDQHVANQMAAYCAITMSPQNGQTLLPDVQRRLFDCFDWVLSDHLRELHPLIWAQAAYGLNLTAAVQGKYSTRDALWNFGHNTARQIIARHFHDDLIQGTTITFSRHGLRLYPAI